MAAKRIWKKNATVLIGGVDLTPYANRADIDPTQATPQSTTLDDDAHTFEPGLVEHKYAVAGCFAAATADPHGYLRALTQAPVIVADGRPATTGALAYVLDGVTSKFSQPMKVGDLWSFTAEGMARRRSGWGAILDYDAALAADGQSAELTLPAVASGQELLLALLVMSGSAGDLDVVVESDDTTGFPSAITRATFATVASSAAPTYELIRVPGPITDTLWRADYTRTGGGTWGVALAAAIV